MVSEPHKPMDTSVAAYTSDRVTYIIAGSEGRVALFYLLVLVDYLPRIL